MSTWLLDTALFQMLATPMAKSLLEWCETNDASLYISAASLTEIALAINKLPLPQMQRASAQRSWLNGIVTRFADRIHLSTPQSPRAPANSFRISSVATRAIDFTARSWSRPRRFAVTA